MEKNIKWGSKPNESTVVIRPRTLRGKVTPPPSKSVAHRAIFCAALAEGTSVIENIAFSQDILATLRCMEALGAGWSKVDDTTISITGTGGAAAPTGGELPRFHCGESGSTLRFLIPVALAVAGGGIFTGEGRLMERPQEPYFQMFREKGIRYEHKDGVLTLRGNLTPGEYRLPGNVSSQFFTGLLLALPMVEGESRIISTTPLESWDYAAMTVAAQRGAGIQIDMPEQKDANVNLPVGGIQRYQSRNSRVESDWSQAAFWYAANFLDNQISIDGLNPQSGQGDMRIASHYWQLARPGDREIDVSQCPDLVPPLGVMAALANGTTTISNAARLRLKESDRLASVTAALTALGAWVEEYPDRLVIHGRQQLAGGAVVDCCNDHRIAMMAAVAATRCQEPVTLLGAQCVRKSYPNFWEHYQMLGGDLDVLISG